MLSSMDMLPKTITINTTMITRTTEDLVSFKQEPLVELVGVLLAVMSVLVRYQLLSLSHA